jgi:UDP-N-acetyl-2-amino-2-deoxyglucuronate dehydrogenase
MDPVRLGVVGCGVIGKVHLAAAKEIPELETLAVADMREDAAREAADCFSVPRAYTDAGEMFADAEVEAVILALPAHARTNLALAAFATGKHVLTEKPVAMNAGEVRVMIEARGDLVGGCCSSRYRFLPSADAAAEFIAGGYLGSMRVVRCRAISAAGPKPDAMPPAWRLMKSLNSGGILANWGCYDLDYLLGITGWSLRPRTVLARTWPISPQLSRRVPPESDAETHYSALVTCDDGAVLSIERGEYMAARTDQQWKIIGDRGSLELTMVNRPGKRIVHEHVTDEGLQSEVVWEGEEDASLINRGLLLDFALSIREGRQPKTGLEQALVVQQITDAIYESAEQGEAIKLPLA